MPEETPSETRNPRTRELTISSLNRTFTLRPLPIYICREISKDLRPHIEKINRTGRVAMVLTKEVEKLQAKFGSKEIDVSALMTEMVALADKMEEAVPKEMDDEMATAVVEVFSKVLKFYDKENAPLKRDIEDKVSMQEIIETLDLQVELNSKNDFLLSSLQFVLKIIKQSSTEMDRLTEALKR